MPDLLPPQSASSKDYDQQLQQKLHKVSTLLHNYIEAPFEVFRSPPEGYRMRAEFRIWHSGEEIDYVMFPKGDSRTPLKIDNFPPASLAIQTLMPKLLAHLRSRPIMRRKLFQVDFLSTRDEQCLVSLIYHRRLDDEWQQAAEQLQHTLNIKIIGRSRKQKVILETDFVTERFEVGEKSLSYQQIENSFTQPNAWINESMLGWVFENTRNSKDDLLELYCGNGNFSIAVANNFRKVLATEMDKNGIRAAKINAEANDIKQLELVRLSAAEVASALNKARPFRRLSHIDLDSYRFSTVLVDPPRAGLDDAALGFAASFERIIYISCNPLSLAENLSRLCNTGLSNSHRISRAAIFDQFPGTEHIECGLVLERLSLQG